jgi:hypothetical protein
MKEVTIKLYAFEELSKKVQEKLIEENRNHEAEHEDWYEPIIEGFEEELREAGFSNEITTGFSGFWSQGDGASFHADVIDNQKLIDTLIEGCYLDKGTDISNANVDISVIKITNRYEHANTITANVDGISDFDLDVLEHAVTKWARDRSNNLYQNLEQYHDEITSNDYVTDYLVEQGEVFMEDGKRL